MHNHYDSIVPIFLGIYSHALQPPTIHAIETHTVTTISID